MRRKKIEITEDVKENVDLLTNFISEDFKKIKNLVDETETSIANLSKMKHTDYVKARKYLLKIKESTDGLRSDILNTHKIFTEEYNTKK